MKVLRAGHAEHDVNNFTMEARRTWKCPEKNFVDLVSSLCA